MSCPECVSGSLHTGAPKGTEIKVANIDAYAIGAEDSKRIIFLGTDIFGWKLVNTRLLADEYAAKGYRVIVPDLFNGSALPTWTLTITDPSQEQKSLFTRYVLLPLSMFVFVPFVLRNRGRQVSIITSVAEALRTAHPTAKIGFVGFCWGGRFAFTQNALFDATVACHPSLVQFPAELGAIKHPFSLAVAEADSAYNREKAMDTEKILREKGFKDFEVVVYEGVQHGWTIRSNLQIEKQKKERDRAVAQVLGWFDKYLSSEAPAEIAGAAVTAPPAGVPS